MESPPPIQVPTALRLQTLVAYWSSFARKVFSAQGSLCNLMDHMTCLSMWRNIYLHRNSIIVLDALYEQKEEKKALLPSKTRGKKEMEIVTPYVSESVHMMV